MASEESETGSYGAGRGAGDEEVGAYWLDWWYAWRMFGFVVHG